MPIGNALNLKGTPGQRVVVLPDGNIGVESIAISQSSPIRALNTVYQISTTKNCNVYYSVDISESISLAGGTAATIFLEIATNSAFTTGLQVISKPTLSFTSPLSVTLNLVLISTAQLSGCVPAGYYARLRTVTTTGTPIFTFQASQEVLW